jgi:class 3 adenylate cyclase
MNDLRSLLDRAKGRSEHVIIVFCDIRGFSQFSSTRGRQATDVAMLIKRFYKQLLDKYFPNAQFVKPTGDGLLLTFEYDDANLDAVARSVLKGMFRCLKDYPGKFFKGDGMINFVPPDALGFGVSRGSASCLYSEDVRIDYSGHLLNVAARLNDYARPGGIVLDGSFLWMTIPKAMRGEFSEAQVYVRSIAETDPISVFYTKKLTKIPEYALYPMSLETWAESRQKFSAGALRKMIGVIDIPLKGKPVSPSKIKLMVECTSRKTGHIAWRSLKFTHHIDSGGDSVRAAVESPKDFLKHHRIKNDDDVVFTCHYVAAPIAGSKPR